MGGHTSMARGEEGDLFLMICKVKPSLKRHEWYVKTAPLKEGQAMVKQFHYARGGSNTCVYMHGLYRKSDDKLHGVAWWLPPTKVACVSVNKDNWKRVLSLTRLVMIPETPKNACSFLLGKSVKMIKQDNRFVSLVTYADDAENHTGQIYKASNWDYIGVTGPYPKWIDPRTGRQVAKKATKNRRKAEMLSLGYTKQGSYYKHKYVMHLGGNMAWNEASLKKTINKDLDKLGAWHYAPCQMGYGVAGIPDIIACRPTVIKKEDVGKTFGLFIGIEAKINYNKPTAKQMHQLKEIAKAHGMALVITGKKGQPYKTERIVDEVKRN